MIKLKKLLQEFTFGTGHLGNNYVDELTDMSLEDFVPTEALSELGFGKAKKYLKYFKKNGTYIGSINNEYLVYRKDSGPSGRDSYYYVVDPNAPIQSCILGYIGAYTAPFRGAYSPKNTFELQGTVRQVHISRLANEYRGKGIGSQLYDLVWKDSDVFASDSVLYEGSYNMWVKHIFRNAAFFGVVLGTELDDSGTRVIIPLQEKDALNKELLGESGSEGFVAIKDAANVPVAVRKVAYNLKGVDIAKQLIVFEVREKLNKKLKNGSKLVDFIEGFANMRQLLGAMERLNDADEIWINAIFNNPSTNITTAIFMFLDATVIVKTQGGQLTSVLI